MVAMPRLKTSDGDERRPLVPVDGGDGSRGEEGDDSSLLLESVGAERPRGAMNADARNAESPERPDVTAVSQEQANNALRRS
mmetsp:Transcript_38973/g.93791  ORF Transcript_38973/g.93791 Transcript_38973/m.93791 type:complete len:82 (+) Transcript_38973:667-912(+)